MEQNVHFFVSFSSQDKKYVREIMAALSGQGIYVWDYSNIIESIEPGRDIPEKLKEQINLCTHMIIVISENSMTSPFCRLELEYAQKRAVGKSPYFIPVMVNLAEKAELTSPYDIFRNTFYLTLNETVESIVKFTVKVCQALNKVYIPPIVAHAKLPFWELFRKEVEEMAHSNKEHVDLMITLGEFNEYYRNAGNQNTDIFVFTMNKALLRITYFLITCEIRVPDYKPFYPRIVKAVCETELGMFGEAMKSYETARIIHPENQDVIGGIGTVYFNSHEYRKAADCFEHIIKTNKTEDISNARVNLIITKQHMGTNVSMEEDLFLFSVKTDTYPDDLKTSILNAQAVQLKIKKNYQALEKHCKEVLSKNLHDTVTIRLLQGSYISRGMYEAARKVITDALKEAKQNIRLDKVALMKFEKE